MWGWRSSRTVVIGLAAAFFVVSCVLPLASFLTTSLRGATAMAIIPGRITSAGNSIFGTAAMTGVRRAAFIESAAIARWTTRKSVHQ